MTTKYTVTRFQRIENSTLGQGLTVEYSYAGEILAYVDYDDDGVEAAVTVFNPYRGGRREYSHRPAARAEAIAIKHVTNY